MLLIIAEINAKIGSNRACANKDPIIAVWCVEILALWLLVLVCHWYEIPSVVKKKIYWYSAILIWEWFKL